MFSLTTLSLAEDKYYRLNYKPIDIFQEYESFFVKESIAKITMPDNATPFKIDKKSYLHPQEELLLIGSAEQFLINKLINDRQSEYHSSSNYRTGEKDLIEEKFYQCFSPCFRDERLKSTYHTNIFYKIELFSFCRTKNKAKKILKKILKDAFEVMDSLSIFWTPEIKRTSIGFDIVSGKQNIEIGSYGIRKINLKNYINERGLGDKVKDEIVYVIYGTGLAEPRFSMVDVEK